MAERCSTDTSGLLPCPFCGSDPKVIDGTDVDVGHFVRCEYCRLDYPSAKLNSREKAVALWNDRPGVAQAAPKPVCDLCDVPLMCAACGHEQRPAQPMQGGDKGEAVALIDVRLADLREADDVFREMDWDKSSDIQRNDREIRWLIDLRTLLLATPQPASIAADHDLGCLKFYIENMNEANWKDMHPHAVRQVERMGTGAADYTLPDRETIGRAIYLAMYQHKGGRWEANETKDVWYEMADRFAGLCALSSTNSGSAAK